MPLDPQRDPRRDCECRKTSKLCQRCYVIGFRCLAKDGFVKWLQTTDAKYNSLRKTSWWYLK